MEPSRAETLAQKWERQYAALLKHQRVHGRGYIPVSHPTLGMWAKEQRRLYHSGDLVESRAARLDAVGFEWGTTRVATWERRYRELAAYWYVLFY